MTTLQVKNRDESKKPNQLRESGFTPIALVEHGKPTRKLQAPSALLTAALAKGHDDRVINLQVEDEKKERTVFIKQIDRNSFKGEILTVTLNQVNKTELMTVEVPVISSGTPVSVLHGSGVLVAATSTIRITGNYSDLPTSITIDTSELGINDNVHASDVKLPKGTELACPPDTTLFMIQTLRGVTVPDPPAPPAPVVPEA